MPPPGLAAMWAGWVQTLLNASQRVARLDASEGVQHPGPSPDIRADASAQLHVSVSGVCQTHDLA